MNKILKWFKSLFKKVDDYMRFYPPPYATTDGWVEHDLNFKKEAPLRYLFKYTIVSFFKRKAVYPVSRLYDKISSYFRYRTYDTYHLVDTKLAPGYYETETRLLHANFSLLVDFVEVEQAWNSDESYKKNFLQRLSRTYYRKTFRSRECAEKYYEWSATKCGNTYIGADGFSQVSADAEIFNLYKWWVDERLKRTEPLFSDMGCDDNESNSIFYRHSTTFKNNHPERYEYEKLWFSDSSLMEELSYLEENIMLERLIAVRRKMWT